MTRSVIPILPVQPPLAMVVVEVTTWCNLQCPGCTRTIGMEAGTWNSRHMPTETFAKVIGNLPRARQIVLHGVGEPTLHPNYLDLIRMARRSGKFDHIVCITNGLTRGLDYFDQMLNAGMNSFTVSVDSLDQTVADRTRTGTKVEKLRERLRAFAKRRYPFAVNMVASRTNLADIPRTLADLDELGVGSVHLQRYIEFDDRPNCLSDDEVTQLIADLNRLQPTLRHVRVNYPALLGPAQGTPEALCASPWREPAVTVEGRLTPCCVKLSPEPLPELDLTQNSFAELQATDTYGDFLRGYARESPDFCDGCFNNRRPALPRPLVSVTMVTYNHAAFVREAVESVLAQDYSPLEIIISDDASGDATASIVEECLARYQGPHLVRFLRQPVNLGARGRNNFLAGYRESRGDFIVWFCGDDIMGPGQITRMVDVWQRERVSLVTVNAAYIDEHSRLTGRLHRPLAGIPVVNVEALARNGANDCCFGAGMGFTREVVETFGFDETQPPPEFPPDLVFPFYAGLLAGCGFITEPLLRYRQHGAQTSASLQLESEPSALGRRRLERSIWAGHLAVSEYLKGLLERLAANQSERFGSHIHGLLPLLAEQSETMRSRMQDIDASPAVNEGSGESAAPVSATVPMAAAPAPSQSALVEKALEQLRANDLQRAAETCNAALQIYPEAGPFWFMMALIMRSVGDLESAARMLDSALRCDPENPEYLNELATLRPAVPKPASTDAMDALTIAPRVSVYLIDVSDECNLRCVYCHQSQPGYEGQPMAPALLETLQQMVLSHPPLEQAFLSSGGETTTLKNWHAIVGRFVALGVPCALISNFARPFADEEIAALAMLREILISIDTIDAELTKRIRKRSDIRTILHNMQRIRAHCVTTGQTPPRFVWNAVGHDVALLNAPSLAAAAAVYRPDQVTIASMKAIPQVEASEVHAVEELDAAARARCASALSEAVRILDRHHIPYSVNEQLKIQLGLAPGQASTLLPAGMTRNCLMPWELFLTHSNGTVKPCCNAEGVTIGRIEPGVDPMYSVFNGTAMRQWRRAMLSDDPPEACQQCTGYAVTSPAALAQRVQALLAGAPRVHQDSAPRDRVRLESAMQQPG